jgi:type IV secretory pathway VirB4 component
MASESRPTQSFVPIKEVRDGIIILEDGSLRAILLTSSVNFALKSEDEQKSLIYQFQNLLNSLDFSIQIFIESRRLDIRPYIAILEERYKEQTSELLKIQTREYIEFVKTFTENSNIMTKSFFVVIPYSAAALSATGGFGAVGESFTGLLGRKKSAEDSRKDATTQFEELRTQLEQRISVVEQGLTRMGVRVVELGTEEVIELFYKIFNPGELEKPVKVS